MNKTKSDWRSNPRWHGIERTYSLGDVQRLQGSVVPEHTLARRGAEKLWELAADRTFRSCAWRTHGKSSRANGTGWIESNLSERLASRRGQQSRWAAYILIKVCIRQTAFLM